MNADLQWIAPSGKDLATDTLDKRPWAAADQFRANSGLSAAQYSRRVPGLIRAAISSPPGLPQLAPVGSRGEVILAAERLAEMIGVSESRLGRDIL